MKYLLVILLFITACQGSTTLSPHVTEAEIQEEKLRHQELVKSSPKFEEFKEAPMIDEVMERRFKYVAKRIGVAGEDLCQQIGNEECKFGFELKKDEVLNAYADGDDIIITSAMMKFASREYELANIMAHEYAHNMMAHINATRGNIAVGTILGAALDLGLGSAGLSTGGVFTNVGGQAGVLTHSIDFEKEADYIGLYIMQRAGFEISETPNFWRKMSVANGAGIDSRVTHPTNPERFVALRKTIEEIEHKKKTGQPLVPTFQPEDED